MRRVIGSQAVQPRLRPALRRQGRPPRRRRRPLIARGRPAAPRLGGQVAAAGRALPATLHIKARRPAGAFISSLKL